MVRGLRAAGPLVGDANAADKADPTVNDQDFSMGPAVHPRQAVPPQGAIAFDFDAGLFQFCERRGVELVAANPI